MASTTAASSETATTIPVDAVEKNIEAGDVPIIENPIVKKEFSALRKNIILAIVSGAGFLGPVSSTVYIPAVLDVEVGLNTTISLVNLTISMYILFLGAGPLVWAPLSEMVGRRPIYIISSILYTGCSVGCALSPNFGSFIALRILQAIGSSASQVLGAGVIADIFPIHERGQRMGFFFLGPLLGPVVGPIVGGVMNQHLGWRSLFWFLTILGGVFTLGIIFLLPETLPKVQSLRWFNPLAPLRYFRYPAVSIASTYPALCFGFMYLLLTDFPESFSSLYGWSSTTVGLGFIAGGIGNVVGTLIGGRLADRARRNGIAKAGGGEGTPEMRLKAIWYGAPLVPIGYLIYGWTLQAHTHYIVPLIGYFIQGVGLMIGFTVVNTYFVDAFSKRAASVIGATSFYRCIIATVTPLFAVDMVEGLGNGWTYTILAIISAVAFLCIVAVSLRGPSWRPSSSA